MEGKKVGIRFPAVNRDARRAYAACFPIGAMSGDVNVREVLALKH
jgi:hypothetical protein